MGDKKKKKNKKDKKKRKKKERRRDLEGDVAELLVGDALRAHDTAEAVLLDVARQVDLAVDSEYRCAASAETTIPAVRYLVRLNHGDPRSPMLRQLLVAACDRRSRDRVHGYFAELIARLRPDEARLLRALYHGVEVVRIEAAYPGPEDMMKVRAVECDQLALAHPERLLAYLEHLAAMHLSKLTTGSPPGAAIRSSGGNVVGHRVHHRAVLTAYGRQLCEVCLPAPPRAQEADVAGRDTGAGDAGAGGDAAVAG